MSVDCPHIRPFVLQACTGVGKHPASGLIGLGDQPIGLPVVHGDREGRLARVIELNLQHGNAAQGDVAQLTGGAAPHLTEHGVSGQQQPQSNAIPRPVDQAVVGWLARPVVGLGRLVARC